jgi:hypothetical protein
LQHKHKQQCEALRPYFPRRKTKYDIQAHTTIRSSLRASHGAFVSINDNRGIRPRNNVRSDSTNFFRLPDYVKHCSISTFKAAATTRELIDTSALIWQHRKLSLLRSPSGRFLQVSYERQRIRSVRR